MNFIEKIAKLKYPYVIAEIGINHNGSLDLAKEMIDAAKSSLADCVKFQLFIADDYISDFAEKADYQNIDTLKNKTQKQIIKETELTINDVIHLKDYCKSKNIDFLCTPFEIQSLRKLIELKPDAIKISSCNLTNHPFLREAAFSKLPILLSTGMGNLKEVEKAVSIFKKQKSPLLLFQCTSNYPSKLENANLNVLKTYKKIFNVPIGFSDHTESNICAIVSVALGALVIEKHFTTSRDLPGIDQKASITPIELKKLVKDLRNSKLTLGSYEKNRSEEENSTFNALRRSLVAKRNIKRGEVLNVDMIDIMRPGNGLPPESIDLVIGKKCNKDISKHNLLKLSDIVIKGENNGK